VNFITSHKILKFFIKKFKPCLWTDLSSNNYKKVMKNWKIKVHLTLVSQNNMLWLYMHIFNATSVRVHISEEEKIVWPLWINLKMLEDHLKLNNWFVLTAAKYQSKIARNMGKTSFNSNVNFVVALLNGFVGEILIFVSHVIKDNVMEIMWVNIQRTSFRNAKLVNVQLEVIMKETANKRCLVVQFVVTSSKIKKDFDSSNLLLISVVYNYLSYD